MPLAGLSLGLAPTLGASPSSTERLWGVRDASGLAPFGGRFTGKPNLGFGMSDGGARAYRIGRRLTSAVRSDPGFEVNLDATGSEVGNGNEADNALVLGALVHVPLPAPGCGGLVRAGGPHRAPARRHGAIVPMRPPLPAATTAAFPASP